MDSGRCSILHGGANQSKGPIIKGRLYTVIWRPCLTLFPQTVITCEIKLFWHNFKIISVFYFTCYNVGNWNTIISAAERVLNLFKNYFSDIEHVGKYSWAAIILWNNFEIISCTFPCAEIKLFQTDVDKNLNIFWNNVISHLTTALRIIWCDLLHTKLDYIKLCYQLVKTALS